LNELLNLLVHPNQYDFLYSGENRSKQKKGGLRVLITGEYPNVSEKVLNRNVLPKNDCLIRLYKPPLMSYYNFYTASVTPQST